MNALHDILDFIFVFAWIAFFWMIVPMAVFSLMVGCCGSGIYGIIHGLYRAIKGNTDGWLEFVLGSVLMLVGVGLAIFLGHFYIIPLMRSSK